MAEAIFNDLIDDHPRLRDKGFRARSAGTFAINGAPMTQEAIDALEAIGIEMDHRHKARSFSAEIANEATLILGVQEMILEEILALAPQVEDHAHTLRGYGEHVDGLVGNEQYDIEDPYRESAEVYIESAKQIKEAVKKVMARMEKEQEE